MTSSHADGDIELTYQGAAGRKPLSYLTVKVEQVMKDSGGFLGIMNSPSMARSFPDGTIVTVRTADGTRRLRGPRAEFPGDMKAGDRVAVGIADNQHFLCVLSPPPSLDDSDVERWAASQGC